MKTNLKENARALKSWFSKKSQELIKWVTFVVGVATLVVPAILHQQDVKVEAIALFFTGLAILLAVSTNISKLIDDHVLNSFDNATQLLDTIKDILVPIQNDRRQWIYAARLVLLYQDLKDQVLSPSKLKHLQVHEINIRYKITDELDRAGGNGVEPAFFYGLNDWENETDLDISLKKSKSNATTAGWVNPNKNQTEPLLLDIPIKAVIAVYDFLEYQNVERDQLDDVTVWNDDHSANFPSTKQGAHKYVIHARDHLCTGDEIFKTDKDTGEMIKVLKKK